MATNRSKLMNTLQAKFPKMWMKKSEEFDGREDCIWTGEGSSVDTKECDDIPLFDYYDTREVLYTIGVYTKLAELLEKNGWYAEFQDAGMVMIAKS